MSKIDTSSWKKFKVSDLFGKAKLGKYHSPETLTADPNGYEYICASNLNNGVNKDLPRVTGTDLQLTPPNIIAWGKQCPMFTYHKDPCVTSQGMYYIELGELSERCALFIIALLEHACRGQYGYNNCLIGSKFDEIEIPLPVTSVEKPDWDYMQERIAELEQERIAELEQERIAELEQYLIAAGLNDYTLTEEDIKTLSLSGTGYNETGHLPPAAGVHKEMREFRMGDLFEYIPVKKAQKKDVRTVPDREFNIPVVYAKFGDNGIMYWGRRGDFDTYANVISVVYNGVIAAGKVYAQEEETGILAESYLIRVKNADVPFLSNLYMAIAIEKVIYPVYSREWLAIWNGRVETNFIRLPIQTNANGQPLIDTEHKYHPDGYVPDWNYMATYIRAIEKLVIKDVVNYKNTFVTKAKEAVGT